MKIELCQPGKKGAVGEILEAAVSKHPETCHETDVSHGYSFRTLSLGLTLKAWSMEESANGPDATCRCSHSIASLSHQGGENLHA